MVRVSPAPLTVMVAVRWDIDVLGVAVTVTVLLPEPIVEEAVSQDSIIEIAQLELDVIVNVFCSPAATKLNEFGDTVKVGVGVNASCVI